MSFTGYIIAASIIIALAGTVGGYFRGYVAGKTDAANTILKQQMESVSKSKGIDAHVRNLPPSIRDKCLTSIDELRKCAPTR